MGHVTDQCLETGDELAAKTEAMSKEVADILAKHKTSHKLNETEVKTYSAGCVANKDDKEYVSRVAVVCPCVTLYQTHISFFNCDVSWTSSPTQIATKKYEGSVVCSDILDQKFVPGNIFESVVRMNVVENTSRQELAGGKRVNILRVTGDTTSTQVTDVVFSIKTNCSRRAESFGLLLVS